MTGVGGDVRVDGRLAVLGEPADPPLVVAAGVECVPREVEVVLEEAGQVVGRGTDLDEIPRVPRPAQGDGRLVVEEHVDVERLVGLARAALLELLHEPHDRSVLLGERGLVAEVGRCRRRGDERKREQHEERAAGGHFHLGEQYGTSRGRPADGGQPRGTR